MKCFPLIYRIKLCDSLLDENEDRTPYDYGSHEDYDDYSDYYDYYHSLESSEEKQDEHYDFSPDPILPKYPLLPIFPKIPVSL